MTRPQITVEIAFIERPFASSPTWTDVSADVLAVSEITHGRPRLGASVQAGQARVTLDNSAGAYAPDNWASPYHPYLLPMRPIRVRATWGATTVTLFRGFVERWPPTLPGGLDTTVTLECTDWFAVLSTKPVTMHRGIEVSHWRVLQLSALAGVGIYDDIPTSGVSAGQTKVAAVDLDHEPVLATLQSVMAAEDGLLFVSGAGILTFQGRHHRLSAARSVAVQLVLGDSDDTTTAWTLGASLLGAGTVPRAAGWTAGTVEEHPWLRVEPEYDAQAIINESTVTASGGTPQTASDAASQTRYGVRAHTRSLLLTSDVVAADAAAWEVARNKDAELRFPRVTVSGLRDESMWPALLGLELSDRVEVRLRPPRARAIVRACYVEQITHRDLLGRWETTLALSPAVDSSAYLRLDTGRLDTSRLGY